MFYRAGEMGWSYLSLSLTGSLIGFLFFNVTPAKIFMGDSGSLVLGFVAAVLSIKFMGVSAKSDIMVGTTHITSVAGLVVSILIIPIFDTLRVFTLRILRNTSPFTADSNHLHHRLLFLGLSHVQATLVLTVVNAMFIVMALSLQNLDNTQLVSLLMLTILGINGGLSLYIEQYKKSLFATKTKTAPAKIDIADTLSQPKKSFGEEILEKISEN